MLALFGIISCCIIIVSLSRRIHPTWNETRGASYSLSDLEGAHNSVRSLMDLSTDPQDHLVTSLPGFAHSTFTSKQYSGMLPVDGTGDNYLFYWLFEANDKPEEKPLVVWLNGGPGCSSMDGLFLELGPLRIVNNGERIEVNPHGWHKAANMLFVDQPVGTGLAFTKSRQYAKNDQTINEHFYRFMMEFFKLHRRFTVPSSTIDDEMIYSRRFFMSGESHAGHYIPNMAAYMLRQNAALRLSGAQGDVDSGKILIDLQGIALGNPWTDPFSQYDVSDFMHGLGVITHGQRNKLKSMEKECQASLTAGKMTDSRCYKLLDDVIDASATGSGIGGKREVLMYDARKYVSSQGIFPPGKHDVEAYLNRPDVRAALHASATPQRFVECADPPFNALSHQDGKGATSELVEVLNSPAKVHVLIFSGQFDIICNHMGNEKMLNRLQWSGREHWLVKANNVPFVSGGEVAGYLKSYGNLGFLVVLNAGHMVPMDQPAVALDMITRFVSGNSASANDITTVFGVDQGRVVIPMGSVDENAGGADTTIVVEKEHPKAISGKREPGVKEGKDDRGYASHETWWYGTDARGNTLLSAGAVIVLSVLALISGLAGGYSFAKHRLLQQGAKVGLNLAGRYTALPTNSMETSFSRANGKPPKHSNRNGGSFV